MDEETDKQAEARRVLEAIRNKGETEPQEKSSAIEPVRWLVSEDAAQLQALVDQSRGIKNQVESKEALLEPATVEPISVEQIKVMRQTAASNNVHKTAFLPIIYEAIIRFYFETIDFFKPSSRAKRCLAEGHQCLHCGQKFPAAPIPASNSNDPEKQ